MSGVYAYKNNSLTSLNHEEGCEKVSKEAKVLKNLPQSDFIQGANQSGTLVP